MNKLYSTFILLAMTLFSLRAQATEGSSILVEFGSTSMTIELSQTPKIVKESGNLVLKTSSMSVTLSLPCKVTPINCTNSAVDELTIRNNSSDAPINVFTIDGKKVGTLKDKNEALSLDKGVYIINGKKVFIK